MDKNPKYSRTNGPKKNGRLKRSGKKKASRAGKKPMWLKILISFAVALVVALVVGVTVFFVYASSAPKLSEQQLESAGSTVIYDSNGKRSCL